MRIGLIAPPWIPVPPPRYGGTEVVVDCLARGLRDLNHDVRLFTLGESTCPVRRDHLYRFAREPLGQSVEEAAHVLAAYEALADVDIIHDHTVLGPLLAAQHEHGPPVVTTHHGPFTPDNRRILRSTARRVPVIAISHDQASRALDVPVAAVIHHGVDMQAYRPGPGTGDYLVFIGRMSADKGVDAAIDIARRAGKHIVLATKMREPAEIDFYRQVVEPMLGADTDLRIEPTLPERVELMRHALALVNPIDWPEPFGLVMAEALACGTPVLAHPCGAAPEIVDDGVTGFLSGDDAVLAARVARVPELDRRACRDAAERRFSIEQMAGAHETFYYRVLRHHDADEHWSRGGVHRRPAAVNE